MHCENVELQAIIGRNHPHKPQVCSTMEHECFQMMYGILPHGCAKILDLFYFVNVLVMENVGAR